MNKKKVLLVDDSTSASKKLAQIIDDLNGYEVIERAKDGAKAIQLYKLLGPDIVCMDIVMPVLDGLQATRMILQIDANAKIVMISSIGGSEEKTVDALKAGAKTVIAKPFEADKIEQVLNSLYAKADA